MAYCDRCGAYIPDGWTACPACGFSAASESAQQQAAQAQTHQAEQEKFAREEAEKRRAQRQAYDKTWAENEQRRRREEEELRRRQQEQEERSRQEREKHARKKENGGVDVTVDPDGTKNVRVGDRLHIVVSPDGTKRVKVGDRERIYAKSDLELDLSKAGDKVRDFFNSDAVNKAGSAVDKAGEKIKEYVNSDTVNKAGSEAEKAVGKLMPILSYLGPLCFVPLILGNDDFTKFHSKQGLRLFIASKILQAIGGLAFGSVISVAVEIFQVLMALIGIKNVINGEKNKLPYIGG